MWKIALFTTAAMFVLAGLVLFASADDAAEVPQPVDGVNQPYGVHDVYRVGGHDGRRADLMVSSGHPDAGAA